MNAFFEGVSLQLLRGALPLLCGAVIFAPLSAAAQDAGSSSEASAATTSSAPRVLVGKIAGDKDNQARSWLIDGVSTNGEYVFISDAAALKLGSDASETEVATIAAEQMADAVVVGSSKPAGKGFALELKVYDGADGRLIKTLELSSKSKGDYEERLLSGADVVPVLKEAQGWPREQASPDAAASGEEADGKEGQNRPSPLRLVLGARLYSRSLRYTDGLWDRDPNAGYREGEEYTLGVSPMPRAELHWYPAAHFTDGWASHLGVVFGYEVGIGSAVTFGGAPLDQKHDLIFGGLRGRLPLGQVTLGLQSTFTSHRFVISGDENLPGQPAGAVFPDVSYKQIELGGDVEWRNEKMILGAHASLNLVLDVGEIGTSIGAAAQPWFPGTSAMGGDFGVYTGWQLSRVFDLLVGADFRAYGLNFGPVDPATTDPSQVIVAGGATDRYISFWGGVAIHWPSPDDQGGAGNKKGEAEPTAPQGESEGGDGFDDF